MNKLAKDGKEMERNSSKEGITSTQKKKTPLQKKILMTVTLKKCCSWVLNIRINAVPKNL